jgi:hypothetical protein
MILIFCSRHITEGVVASEVEVEVEITTTMSTVDLEVDLEVEEWVVSLLRYVEQNFQEVNKYNLV